MLRSDVIDELVSYSDFDWARFKDARQSTGGYAFLFSSTFVLHQSKQQAITTLFSTKVRDIFTTKATKKAL